jgi:hypothetical protein
MLSTKVVTTITLALLFIVISSPLTYKIVENTLTSPLGFKITQPGGSPTRVGLILHAIVYALLVHFIVIKKRC